MLGLLLDNIDVMQSESKLVGSSKVIHHLLPDLVPPIDREYTLRFFYGDLTSKYTPLFQKDEESNLFIEIVGYFQNICDKLQLDEGDCDKTKSFNTSIPKIIDNSIIGLVRSARSDRN